MLTQFARRMSFMETFTPCVRFLFVDVVLICKPQGNVLIDGSGNPRLTDFGLATVVGDQELQWTTTTEAREFSSRWRAPEVIGIERDKPGRPTFESDIYSLGSVIFFVRSLPYLCGSILSLLHPDHLRGYTMERQEIPISNIRRVVEESHSHAFREHS
jgi:serine/threonine protein kinase